MVSVSDHFTERIDLAMYAVAILAALMIIAIIGFCVSAARD